MMNGATQEQALACAIATRTPALLWGLPGIGKTATIAALARAMRLPLEVVIAAIHEPADFSGLPVPAGDRVRYLAPEWAVRLVEAGQGILFLDEISTAPPAVQSALLRVVLERRVGQLSLPDDVVIVAAANPPDDAAGGWELATPLANRFFHLDWQPPRVAEWCAGITAGWPQPILPPTLDEWIACLPLARGLVAGFLTHAPHYLLTMPEDPSLRGRAWPSPRTWEMATRMLAAAFTLGGSEEIIVTVVAGCVGEGAAYALAALVSGDRLLDPLAALADPIGCPLPERPDKMIALLMSVTAIASQNPQQHWDAAWTLIGRVASQQRDLAAVAARPLGRVHAELLRRGTFLSIPPEAARPLHDLLVTAGML